MNTAHSSTAETNAADVRARCKELKARPSRAAQSDVKRSSTGVFVPDEAIIYTAISRVKNIYTNIEEKKFTEEGIVERMTTTAGYPCTGDPKQPNCRNCKNSWYDKEGLMLFSVVGGDPRPGPPS
jgi:hypothetical protein